MDARRGNKSSWFWQVSAIAGSILSTAAIGILLAHYDGKPVFDWSGLTLNAIVSVFSALSKALLAFALAECLGQAKWIWSSKEARPLVDLNTLDEASRGPLGSLKLLRSSVARSFISIGALAVVFSAAIDPFVQLTIGKRDALEMKPDKLAQIAYAKRYSKGALTVISVAPVDGGQYANTNVDADFSMKSAIFYGLSESDAAISQHMKYACYSGNCTWRDHESLAVCSACHDLNDQLTSEDQLGGSAGVSLDMTNEGAVATNFTEYKLPNGLHGDHSVAMTAYGTGNESETVSFKAVDTLIWSMTMLKFINTTENEAGYKVDAIECGLWYCVNTYSSVVRNGNLSETSKPTNMRRNPLSWNQTDRNYGDATQGNTTVKPLSSLAYGPSAVFERTDLQIGNDFNLSRAAIYGISDFMNRTFTVEEHSGFPRVNAYVIDESKYRPTVMQQFFVSSDIASKFSSLAKSMTNNIRQNGDNETRQSGEAGTYLILIKTRPWFLALPALLNLACLIFLGLVILQSRRAGLTMWGTNALPLVALGGRFGKVFDSDTMSIRQMDRIAKQQSVRFPMSDNPIAVSTVYHEQAYEIVSQAQPQKDQATADVVSAISTDEYDLVDHGRLSPRSITPDL